jgi:hypothetical protein
MDTPAERAATRADHGIDWDYVNAHHHPVTLIRRPAYEGWVLSLFGAVLVGLIGLLGWAGYALSTVQADLRQVHGQVRQLHAHIAQLEPLSAGREPLPAETAQRLQELDQRLRAVESGSRDAAPRVTALEPRPREHVAKPQVPSPPPSLPSAGHLPRTATSAPRTPQDHQAHRDMRQQAAGRFGAPVPDSFGTWLAWHPEWELRWMRFQVSGHPPVSLYHITYKADPGQRYTISWDPDRRTWQQWTRWPRGS